jgi:pimeloyl-ACP methyl ester carboxylesterase
LSSILNSTAAQDEIQYGSNNGQYITVQNTRIYYEEYGEGVPFFLLHGGYSSIQNFKDVISGLSKHFRVIAVDSPGHGRSEQADTMSYQLIADYISEMMDLMGLDSVYAMGCSDGAIVSLILAHDRPDKVKKVISDGGVINAKGYKSDIVEWMELISPESRSESWIETYKSLSPQPEKWKEFVWDTKRMWLDLPYIDNTTMNRIDVPTLILLGDQDFAITIDHALDMHRAIKDSELGIVPGAGHCVCNTKPDLSVTMAIDFLTKE